jgi:putative peptidoglycan lipid II flippase
MTIEKHARTFMLLTLLSRAFGLLRETVQFAVFGMGPVMDAFSLAFQIPNLFRRLFGEGALTASFVPVYARLERDDPAAARRFAGLLLSLLTVFLAAITVVGELVLSVWPAPTPDASLAIRLIAVMLPYMPMVCVVAVIGAMLGVHGRFGPAAFSPVLLNVGMILAAALAWWLPGGGEAASRSRIGWAAMGVLLAGVAQVAWMVRGLRGMGLRPSLRPGSERAALLETLRAGLPMLLGLGVFQLNVLMDSLIASYPTMVGPAILGVDYPLQQGSNAVMNAATRLYEFPLGVFGIAVATVIFPLLARQADDRHAFVHSMRRGMRLVAFIGVPASIGLMLVAQPFTVAVLRGGAVTAEDAQRVAQVLVAFAPAVAAYSANHLLTRAFYALGDRATPLRISLSMVALNLLLNVTLIWTPLNLTGLAWSTTICAFIQLLLLGRALQARMGRLADDAVWRSLAKTLVATAVMALATFLVDQALPLGQGRWAAVGRTLALAGTGVAAMFVVARRLHMPEWRWALGMAEAEARAVDPGP